MKVSHIASMLGPAAAKIRLGKLNHVAMAVPDLAAAARQWEGVFGATVSAPVPLPSHGVSTVFVELANTKFELLHPLGEDSPIAGFLKKNPRGGLHHVCIEVADIMSAFVAVSEAGIRTTGAKPTIGAHGKLVFFMHPVDIHGCLVELEQE